MPINVLQKEGEEEVAAEVLAQSILDIAKAMKKLSATRLTRKAVVTLVARSSRVSESTIDIVLDHLENLEERWLKPKKK